MNRLDHVVIAVPDLEAAKADFDARTGVEPADGGPHVGLGTRNALVSFGRNSYLELIAPDPAQDPGGTFGAALARLDAPTPLHWAVRTEDLAGVAARAEALGLAPTPVRRTARVAPDGTRLEWELLGIGGHALGGRVPFFIDWLDCVHPAATAPVVGELLEFVVALPAGHPALDLLRPVPDDVEIRQGEGGLTLSFSSPRQTVELTTPAPAGFQF